MQSSSLNAPIVNTPSGTAHDDRRVEEGAPFAHVVAGSDQSPLIDALAALVRYRLRLSADAAITAEAGSLRPAA